MLFLETPFCIKESYSDFMMVHYQRNFSHTYSNYIDIDSVEYGKRL